MARSTTVIVRRPLTDAEIARMQRELRKPRHCGKGRNCIKVVRVF